MELYFDQEGRDKLVSGITKIAKAVKSTLGPLGKTVIIDSPNHTRGLTVTKDGVTVANSIMLNDSVENLGVRMIKEAAQRTGMSAGDGTTTSIVIAEAMILTGMQLMEQGLNMSEISKLIDKMVTDVIKMIDKMSKPVTGNRLNDVATISANNDSNIGKIIASVYKEVGKDGVVTVEKSQTSETYYEVTNGIKIDRGYSSRYFINNQKNDECILDDVYILATDLDINSVMDIENILMPIIQGNKKLLIIGNCSDNLVNTLALNVVKNGLKICTIKPPQFGYKTKELMSDIALSVGAKYFSEDTGEDLSLISMSDLGHAEKVVIGSSKSVIVRDEGHSEEVLKRISELRDAKDMAQAKNDKDFIDERIA